MSPSKEQLLAQKRRADSLYMANARKQHDLISAIAREKVLAFAKEKEKFTAKGEKADSVTLVRLAMKGELGMFANSAAGKDTTYLLENDVFKLNISSRGGKICKVELKDYLTWDKHPLVLMDGDSLGFGLSFFANNRIINTNRLYFQPRTNISNSFIRYAGMITCSVTR
jgi:YidC/Oxa1 family membrane protein insertase